MLAKKVLLFGLEVVVMVCIIGCAPTIIGSDAGVYQHGTLYAVANKDMDSVYAATLFAMDKLQLQVTEKAKDVFAAKVVAKSADDKYITVKMRPEGDQKTSFEIFVGLVGKEDRARKLYADITAGLAAAKTK